MQNIHNSWLLVSGGGSDGRVTFLDEYFFFFLSFFLFSPFFHFLYLIQNVVFCGIIFGSRAATSHLSMVSPFPGSALGTMIHILKVAVYMFFFLPLIKSLSYHTKVYMGPSEQSIF